MAKKSSESSARAKRAKKNAKTTPDHMIDFSDIPEFSDRQLKAMKPLGRPLLGYFARKQISVRIDPQVLKALREEAQETGIGYQSLIHEILAKHVKKRAA